jgi:hypothetical protein
MPLDPNQHAKALRQANKPAGHRVPKERLAALAAAQARPRVRVEPVKEKHRSFLRHPNAGGFRTTGSVEWPLDTFTHRRIKDGSIRIVKEVPAQAVSAPAAPVRASRSSTKVASYGNDKT